MSVANACGSPPAPVSRSPDSVPTTRPCWKTGARSHRLGLERLVPAVRTAAAVPAREPARG
ncbi:hypothetical protein [Actinomadura sp. 21ATH]|uniref:hypothetical protein n=1 Tax=Actinomadura sp. 21ATH TaxID=1735444 RepID=UPI0035C08DD3